MWLLLEIWGKWPQDILCLIALYNNPSTQSPNNGLLKDKEEYILLDKVYFLVNLKSFHARVLNWVIQENIRMVELAQYQLVYLPG